MRHRLMSLILAQPNMNFAISHSRYYYIEKRQRLWEGVLIVVSILMGAAVLSFGVFKLADAFYSSAAVIRQEALTLITGILAAQFLMLILGVALVISVFYFSSDLPTLIPLPLKPWEVLASKFAIILANEYLGLAVFIIPIFVAYGMRADIGLISYVLSSIIVFLALPVIPVAIASILSVILMRIIGFTKRKDMLTTIGGFLLVALIIGVQFYMQTKLPARGNEQEFMMQLLSQANSVVTLVGKQFPPGIWATLAISDAGTFKGFMNLGLFLSVSAISLVVFLMVGNRFFYQGVVFGFEASVPKRDISDVKLAEPQFPERTSLVALAVTEIKLFSRTPVFVLNGFIGFLMFPIMFVVLLLMGNDPEVAGLWESLVVMPEFHSIGALIVGAYFFVLTAFSGIPFSPFSREGKANIWFLRSQPVSGSTAAMGKALGAEIMILLGSIPGVGVFQYIARLPVSSLVIGFYLGIVSSFALCIWGVLLDMARPMLNWTDQQKAIKSNLNILISMLISTAVLFLLGFLVYTLFKKGYSGLVAQVTSGAVVTLLLASGLRVLRTVGDKLWRSIEL